MMYPFMTLDDGTEIVHSEMHDDNTVCVCCERPIDGGFKTAYCTIPGYKWHDVEVYSQTELEDLTSFLKSVAHLIVRFSKNGGFANAACF